MASEQEHCPETGRPDGTGQGCMPGVDDRSPKDLTRQWVRGYEEKRLEVVGQIARGELDELVEQLMDDDEDKRYDVARHIARGGQAVIPRAIELAEDARPRMREMACYILGQVGYPDPDSPGWLIRYADGIPTIVRHLESDPDDGVRTVAAYALGFHREPSTAQVLCGAASHPSCDVRLAVAHALGSFYGDVWEEEARGLREEVIAALLQLMDDEDEEVRDWATFGVHQGRHDTPATRARLWQALDDPYVEVRGEAARGLAEFGDRALIPRLEKLLREDQDLSEYYFWAARELRDPVLLPPVLEAVERWRQGMEEDEQLDVFIASAVEALQEAAILPAEGRGPAHGEQSSCAGGT